MTVRDTFRYTPSYNNVGGFLVWEHPDLDTHPLTIPDKQPDSYLYIYLLSYSTGKAHKQSIYPKYPCPVIWENQNPIQMTTM